ncbi:MAG: hypothetical protein RIG77_09195, partial [Cyclobacteriaceae bacterium]
MKSYRKILLLFTFVFNTFLLYGQETCDDGIDNDGDGFIDCYDADCTNDGDCASFYFGNSVVCRNEPTVNPAFNIKLQWGSDNRTANNSSLPAVGDIDGDGIPEVVVSNRSTNQLSILNGIDGATERSIFADPLSNYKISHDVTIANIDNDECGEIFMAGAYTSGTITAYDCNLTLLWETTVPDNRTGAISVADFNQDGTPELMVGNGIYNATTGAVIISPTSPMATTGFYGTTAVDILPDGACDDCQGLEMVAGGLIYSIDIATGTRTVERDINDLLNGVNEWSIDDYSGYYNMNFSAVADYNQDGTTANPKLDVLFNGKNGNGKIVIYFWDVTNNTVTTFSALNDDDHWLGTGRINISDLDNDGQLNASFVSDQTLYALDENFDILWTKGITEGSSGITGCSVFDFNDDGAAEVLYRSETTLHIIDGTDGSSRTTKACISLTWDEYPIVADVDGDGASEICLACATSNSSDKYSSSDGQIRVYESDGEDWQPSREVWNQHAYFNVNVNDNLTIPVVQQNPGAVFSTNVCTAGPNRPLNTFLNQAPVLNEQGCPSYVSPDLELLDNLMADSPQCPDTQFNVSFDVRNSGDIALSNSFPVTFYAGDPALSTSIKLNTAVATVENLEVGETESITLQVTGPGGSGFDLFVSINDNGSQDPPMTTPIGTVTECDKTNNLASTPITSLPFEIFANKVKDNELCDPTFSDNGIARAYYIGTTAATSSIIWNEDFEDLNVGDIEDNGTTGWSRTYDNDGSAAVGQSGGNKWFRVNDADSEVVWESDPININGQDHIDISWFIKESGNHENSDYIRLYYQVAGGNLEALDNGTFSNDYGEETATASFDNVTSAATMILRAEILNNSSNEYDYMDNIVVTGTVNAASGETTTGATFEWYNGTDFASGPVFTGANVTDMPHGTYSVFAILGSNSCPSDTATVVIDLIEEDPVIKINKLADLTDCEVPNGKLEAVVIVDGQEVTAGYDFTWYLGNDFIDTVSVASIAQNLEARTYTVVAQNKISGCTSNLDEVVDTNLTLPGIQFETKTNITACNDLNGGSITVSSNGLTADYTFNWYHGSSVKAVPDFTGVAGAGATYSGITFGFYTVEAVETGGANPSNCTSAPLVIEVENLTGAPEAEFASTDDSSCFATGGNGSITATSGGIATGFTFDFYEGVSTSPSDRISTNLSGTNNSIAGSLDDGDYTVVITNNSNGCSVTNVVTLNDTSTNPDILDTDVDTTDRTACNGGGADPDNGQIDAVGTASGGSGNYEFILWSGAASGNPLATNNTGLFEQLGSGNYSLKVRDLDTECISDVTSLRINLVRDEPIIGFSSSTANTNCGVGNGTLSVTAQSGVSEPISGYEFSIYQGNNTQASNLLQGPIAVADGSVGHTFTNLLGGNYRVYILNVGNNCDQTEDFIVADNITVPTFDPLVSTPQRSCSTPNGGLFALIDESPGDGFSNYTFEWYAGDLPSGPVISTSNDLTGQAAGQYTVVATSNTSGCESAPVTGTINEQLELPDVTTEVVNSQSNCSNSNGSLKAYTNDPSFPGVEFTDGFTFEWYLGNSAVGSAISAGVDPGNGSNPTFPLGAGEEHTIGGLVADTYTVEVTNDNSGCAVTQTIVLTESIVTPIITGTTNVDNTGCNIATYSGQVTAAVSYNGSNVTDFTGYTFTWYNGNDLSDPVNATSTTEVLSNLNSGDYTVTVTVNGCTSNPFTTTVNDSLNEPTVSFTSTNENTVCDVSKNASGNYDGIITVSHASRPVTDFTFEWFVGQNTTISYTTITGAALTNNDSELQNVPGGTYTLRLTDNVNDCQSVLEYTLADDPANVVVNNSVAADITITDVSSCEGGTVYPNGGATLNNVETNGSTGTYTFAWYVGASATGTALSNGDDILAIKGTGTTTNTVTGASTNSISNLDPGQYTVVATDQSTGCDSSPVTVTIGDSLTPPTATLDAANTNDNTVCDLAAAASGEYTGKITAIPGIGVAADYSWE